ncbi:type I glyceraldehyde-3-phosphate dehydrogenase [Candidatus Methylospira mobilis]|uniref:Glyceraldehyde-3-phosphate dehydrogenase n=1 Tax=Candidatus Methylospira mobilis TaxID=1808979 RepID=A0A5Q0BQJ1_9GAMM|nr:type I glyceraldehyde-3-phosphate dehydrogenase [Candidatus Methylospira mobilis]QFY44347.1 type I glyceraldehyde-3-phosphate dehydrogenase [Candidatus Methylospira mobilis]WNV06221.1 type I glyceraldehyde-3-phosphate dehydrogenase [Candidatus Methylospira mobilis]
MTIKIAINGYGRIGRNVLRAVYEYGRKDVSIVAINDLGDANINAHLTRHDTVHGPFSGTVEIDGGDLVVNGDTIKVYSERDPARLPWCELGVDVVLECTGIFRTKEKCLPHIGAGAKKVIISAPADKNECDATIVFGVNHSVLKASDIVISNASCTTNCLAPLVKPLLDSIGVEHGLMTTIHSYTNDQVLTDVYHKDLYRARAAALNMIPTKTGAAQAVGLVIPELAGKMSGFAIRVPTPNVSVVDLTFVAGRATSKEEVNQILKTASEGPLEGILGYNTQPLVSSDFNHTTTSSNFDATQTIVIDNLVKVLSWYDNEWGFSNRMLDTTVALMNAK